jgi:uncharacterized protein YbjT (DUF2867 family)
MAKVLIFGATGVAGRFIIEGLLEAKSSLSSLGIFTSPSTVNKKADHIKDLEARGVKVHVGDVGKEEDVLKAYEGETWPVGHGLNFQLH